MYLCPLKKAQTTLWTNAIETILEYQVLRGARTCWVFLTGRPSIPVSGTDGSVCLCECVCVSPPCLQAELRAEQLKPLQTARTPFHLFLLV